MPYATRADMELRYGQAELQQLTDRAVPRLGATNDAVLGAVLADASAAIDTYLMARYPLPITDDTALAALRLRCCQIARALLMTSEADDMALKQYEDAQGWLMSVAKGLIDLMPAAAVPQAAGAGSVEFFPGTKYFGRDG
ncbi:MAG: DUF1320 family protein [Burkholderiales bacterium]|nr:DUF1320 family protein [Burkholderiales bacterium]